jgi:hypothetical protein
MPITDVVLGLAAGVGIDLAPDGKTAYYVEWSIGELSQVEISSGKVFTVRTGLSLPQDVEVDWDTNEIFISERTGDIKKLGAEGQPEVIVKSLGAPHQLSLIKHAGKRLLYTVCYDSGMLVCIDVDAKTVIPIATGLGHPVGVVVDPPQKWAYVTEQDKSSLTRIKLADGSATVLHTGLVQPFFLAWDQVTKGIFCVERDPSNSLVRLDLGPPVTQSLVANGLAWRPSGVAPTGDNARIYICADQKLQVISVAPVPPIPPPPPPFAIHSIEFRFDGSPALAMKHHVPGTLVPQPEWITGSRNEPAAYLVGTTPHVKVVLRRLPLFVPGAYSVGAIGNYGGIRRKVVTPIFNSTGLSNPLDFEFLWPLPSTVGKPDASLEWYARPTAAPAVPGPIGATLHRIYLLLDRPTDPWSNEIPWVAALELACGWATSAATEDRATELITRSLNGNPLLSYTPSTMFGFTQYLLSSFLKMLDAGSPFQLNCTDCADAVATLGNLLGCDLWEGRMLNLVTRKILGIGGNPAVDSDWYAWNWSYHEIPWLQVIGPHEFMWDGCLQLDTDSNDSDTIHVPLLAIKMKFSDYRALLVASGPCTLENIPRRRPVV